MAPGSHLLRPTTRLISTKTQLVRKSIHKSNKRAVVRQTKAIIQTDLRLTIKSIDCQTNSKWKNKDLRHCHLASQFKPEDLVRNRTCWEQERKGWEFERMFNLIERNKRSSQGVNRSKLVHTKNMPGKMSCRSKSHWTELLKLENSLDHILLLLK